MSADAHRDQARSAVLQAIAYHAAHTADAIAIESAKACWSYAQLKLAVDALASELVSFKVETIALLADNGPAWALADLAAIAAGLRLVPLPPFFSPGQLRHALQDAGVQAVLADPRHPFVQALQVERRSPLLNWPAAVPALDCLRLPPSTAVKLPAQTQKITYTSGTTGDPKGVCLDQRAMEVVAQSLREATGAGAGHRHLAVLPLSTLLENIGGLYAPLLAGATACLPPMAQIGLSGASGLDPLRLLNALQESRANSAILVPQMLQALVELLEAGHPAPLALRFIAVGGAAVAPRLLQKAALLNLPVYEGYGLSECASVVTLNRPGASRPGSTGQPLPHLKVRIAADGEVEVAGNGFLGYAGHASAQDGEWLATGDLGDLDADGFLSLRGRKRNMFVTAFGRNVSPEWIERELCANRAIAQAAVFGEARPWNAAIVVPRAGADESAINAAIEAANRELPDYAQVRGWIQAEAPFTPANQQLTANGRLRRAFIGEHYARRMDALYPREIYPRATA